MMLRAILNLSLLLILASCQGTSFIGQAELGPAHVGVSIDTNGRVNVTGGFTPKLRIGLGPVSFSVGVEQTVELTKDKPYYLFILWKDENGEIQREEYEIGKEFSVSFENDERIREIRGENHSIVITIERESVFDFQSISISNFSELEAPETNLGLGPGTVVLSGIPFDTGWTTSTQCSHLPNQPEEIIFPANVKNVSDVYFLYQAGWGTNQYLNNEIGHIDLTFEDMSTVTVRLILGDNIRDWAWSSPGAVTTTSSPMVQPGWQGKAPNGTEGGMDILTIKIPSDSKNRNLIKIHLTDETNKLLGDTNPCIHLLAISVWHEK